MDVWTGGADVATMLTGVSAVSAAYVWIRNQVRDRRVQKRQIALRNWQGFIDLGGVNTWRVRLREEPSEPTAQVVLEVIDQKGNQAVNQAENLRQIVAQQGQLSRPPSVEELALLKELQKERGYGKSGFAAGPRHDHRLS